MKFLIIFAFLIKVQADNSDSIDTCIQNKLKLDEPISHKTIFQDIANKSGKFRHAARSALQICHPTFDIVAGQIFNKMAAKNDEISLDEVNCYKNELIKKNSGGQMIEEFDKNLLVGDNCEEIIKDFINQQVIQKMPDGTAEERQCLMNSIDKYMDGRFKAKILARGEFSIEIFNEEKRRFVRELREVSDELIGCLVG